VREIASANSDQSLKRNFGIVLMCVHCVLASPRIAQVDPGDGPPFRGGSVTAGDDHCSKRPHGGSPRREASPLSTQQSRMDVSLSRASPVLR
jgi:hypothetical protein